MITIFEFDSLKPGPTLLVLGGIHGNETCGPRAMRNVMKKIQDGVLTLKRGRVIFVPVSNPLAYLKNKRYVEEDLNRVFAKTKNPKTYEQRLANALCKIVDRSDALLDVHSMGAKGARTMFVDFPTKANMDLARSAGIHLAIVGWPELYRNDKRLISRDTTSYAHGRGKDCLLVECGQHQDPKAPRVAEQVILRVLAHYKIIAIPKNTVSTGRKKLEMIHMSELFIKEHKNDSLAHAWKHLEVVKKGVILGRRNSGELIASPGDRVMILPKYNPPVGKEWFYLGYYEK